MQRPDKDEYPEFFARYINRVAENDLSAAFESQARSFPPLLESISEEKSKYAYAEGKWTIRELIQHIIDTERIFNYRALAIARGETVSLPSFDENSYAVNSDANARSWSGLKDEFSRLRASTRDLYNSFNDHMLAQRGLANNHPISVLSLGFTTVGHISHHKIVLEEKYL